MNSVNVDERVLCVGQDKDLLDTRVRLLSLYYSTTGARGVSEMNGLADLAFDVVVLCHSLGSKERAAVISVARERWPKAKLLGITMRQSHPDVDAEVGALDGPRALVRAVNQLLDR